ncbi:MAG: hypothetical protein LBR43_00380 [Spiroplasmataceae bacterium]|jgi:hypothetical protein|nr:hypothetical protein [Spiroplasmataceae bacterium]
MENQTQIFKRKRVEERDDNLNIVEKKARIENSENDFFKISKKDFELLMVMKSVVNSTTRNFPKRLSDYITRFIYNDFPLAINIFRMQDELDNSIRYSDEINDAFKKLPADHSYFKKHPPELLGEILKENSKNIDIFRKKINFMREKLTFHKEKKSEERYIQSIEQR